MNKYGFFSIAALTAFFDQLSKLLVEQNIEKGNSIYLAEIFRISNIKNTGTAFGMLKDSNVIFALLTLSVILGIIWYNRKIPKNNIAQTGFALILGGAAGNFIDRAFLNGVTDFIDFKFWPAFNIADSALTIGIIMLLFYYYFTEKKVSGLQ